MRPSSGTQRLIYEINSCHDWKWNWHLTQKFMIQIANLNLNKLTCERIFVKPRWDSIFNRFSASLVKKEIDYQNSTRHKHKIFSKFLLYFELYVFYIWQTAGMGTSFHFVNSNLNPNYLPINIKQMRLCSQKYDVNQNFKIRNAELVCTQNKYSYSSNFLK